VTPKPARSITRRALERRSKIHAGRARALKNMRHAESRKIVWPLSAAPETKYLNAGVISIFVSGLLLYGFSTPACAHVLLCICLRSFLMRPALNMHSRCDCQFSEVYSDDANAKVDGKVTSA
jgi:hypothetical protein